MKQTLNENEIELLDRFAGQAMSALVHQTNIQGLKARDVELVTRNAYRIATEMLQVRKTVINKE